MLMNAQQNPHWYVLELSDVRILEVATYACVKLAMPGMKIPVKVYTRVTCVEPDTKEG